MLIYGSLLEICGRGVSCQMQWKAFAIQQNGLNCGAIFMLSRGGRMQEGISDREWKDKNPDRLGGCYVGYRKIKYILKLIVLNWGKAGQIQMTWGNSVTSFDLPMASFKSEVHVRGQRTHSPAPSTHLILIASFFLMTSGFHVILPPSAALPNSRGNLITSQIEQINMNFVWKVLSRPLTYLKMSQIWLL